MAQNRKVVLIVAHEGFQQIEYHVPKSVLKQAGFSVLTASNKPGTATAKDHSTAPVDMLIKDINPADYEAIVFIGGPGTLDNLNSIDSYALLNQTVRLEKVVGAICIATRILAHAGILTDRNATGWDGDHELGKIYQDLGVHYIMKDVVVDGHIVTATGPEVAQDFAQELVAVLG